MGNRTTHGVRRHPRYQVNASADVLGEDVLLYHPIQDLSMGGMRIEAPAATEVGTKMEVFLNFPDDSDVVTLTGEVVWAAESPSCEVGLRWRFPDAQARLRLSTHLEKARVPSDAEAIVTEPMDGANTAPVWFPGT